MKLPTLLPLESRPLVYLLAEPGGLSTSIVEQLLSHFCRVHIFSESEDKWKAKLRHLSHRQEISLSSLKKNETIEKANYFIYVSGYLESDSKRLMFKKAEEEKLSLVENLLEKNQETSEKSRATFLLPFFESTKEREYIGSKSEKLVSKYSVNTTALYVGEVLGQRVFLSDNQPTTAIVKRVLLGKKVPLPKSDLRTYITPVDIAAREVIRNTFSFSGYLAKKAILGGPVLLSSILTIIQRHSSVYFDQVQSEKEYSPKKGLEKKEIYLDLRTLIKDTFEWYSTHPFKIKKKEVISKKQSKIPLIVQIKPKEEDLNRKSSNFNKFLIIGLTLLFLISPYIFLSAGALSFIFSKNRVSTGDLAGTRTGVKLAGFFSNISLAELNFYKSTKILTPLTYKVDFLAETLVGISKIAEKSASLLGIGEEIISGALGRTNYNIFSLSERMSLELDSIYKDMAFLESEFAQRPGVFRFLAGQNFSLEDIKILRSKILLAKKISQELPELMGGNSGKTYLILIQNNMELRPTGGFIGSFGIANFESGKLTSIDIQDVYSADGQLKGYVEPPGVIKKYLNEANWFLRDSNWDPDFPTSAQVAEWFLDKEIAAKVDGVVAIDMGVALKLVELFGEINISDYGTVVNAANLYETTQSQVEEDFFPGSRKKANFLTALSNVLLEKLTNIEPSQVATLGQKLLESMDEKHLQIFFHNTQVQKAISELTWDGAVYTPGCSGNCYADSVGIVEANVGVNKVNYFIQRSAELTTTIGEESVGRTLSINIKNTAPVSLEKKGVYKNYLRVLAPLNSEFGDVLFASELEVTSLKPEVENIRGRSEAGVYVEIPAGEVRSIVFNWTSAHTLNFSEKGEYRMVWRKQAGTGEDAVSVKISTPLAKANAYPEANLTVDGSYTYNTYLARDFSSRIFW